MVGNILPVYSCIELPTKLKNMTRVLTSIRSVNPTVARHICQFVFGKKFRKLIVKKDLMSYWVYVDDDEDEEVVKQFKDYWSGFTVKKASEYKLIED